jgi:hypothetical protein
MYKSTIKILIALGLFFNEKNGRMCAKKYRYG